MQFCQNVKFWLRPLNLILDVWEKNLYDYMTQMAR